MPRTIRDCAIYLNEDVIKDLVAAHLYAMNVLEDDDEVLELHLGVPNMHGHREINFKTIKNKEVELIVHS